MSSNRNILSVNIRSRKLSDLRFEFKINPFFRFDQTGSGGEQGFAEFSDLYCRLKYSLRNKDF